MLIKATKKHKSINHVFELSNLHSIKEKTYMDKMIIITESVMVIKYLYIRQPLYKKLSNKIITYEINKNNLKIFYIDFKLVIL